MRVTQAGGSGGGGSPQGWPIEFFTPGGSNTGKSEFFADNNNSLHLYGIVVPSQVKFNNVWLNVLNTDNAHNLSVGLYDNTGVLICASLAGALAATGNVAFAMVGGPFTINPGRFYLGTTTDGSTAHLAVITAIAGTWNFCNETNFGASVGGVMPATITPPADTIGQLDLISCALAI